MRTRKRMEEQRRIVRSMTMMMGFPPRPRKLVTSQLARIPSFVRRNVPSPVARRVPKFPRTSPRLPTIPFPAPARLAKQKRQRQSQSITAAKRNATKRHQSQAAVPRHVQRKQQHPSPAPLRPQWGTTPRKPCYLGNRSPTKRHENKPVMLAYPKKKPMPQQRKQLGRITLYDCTYHVHMCSSPWYEMWCACMPFHATFFKEPSQFQSLGIRRTMVSEMPFLSVMMRS